MKVNYKCGHRCDDEKVAATLLLGKVATRKERVAILRQTLCTECRAKQGEERGCLPLQGGTKERALAGDLRAMFLSINPQLTAEDCKALPVAAEEWIEKGGVL